MAIKKFNSLKSSVNYIKRTSRAALFAGLFPFLSSACSLYFPDYKTAPADGGVDRIEQRDGSREGGDNDSDVYDAGKDVYDGGADGYDAGDVYDGGDAVDGSDIYDSGNDIHDGSDASDVYDGGDTVDGGGCRGDPPMTRCGLNGRGWLEYLCMGGEHVPVDCSDPDECVDGTRMDVACGLNDRGVQSNVCVDGHHFEGSCRDRDICEDGSVENASCGLNGRGTQSRTCTEGRYGPFTICDEPDECRDGTRSTGVCGLNGRGMEELLCELGHYVPVGPCADLDECRDGSVDMAACGFNGRGSQERQCVDGQYEMFGPCERDPDECVSGAMDRVACGVDLGECFAGLESRLCAVDGMGNFVWQLQGDCDGRNPPLDGARGYREDMNADGVCSVPDLNGLDDDCNGIADDGYCMVIVPEGFFRMGCDSAARADCTGDNPVHNIILSRYSIDKHEVTNDQYRACVTAGSCDPPSSVGSFSRPSYYDNPAFGGYPVIFVNYAQAVAFCSAAGKRLPTEAEWEKAARGTDDRRYPWGEVAPTCELANYGFRLCRDPPDTTEVGSFPLGASPYGALDMAGNVIEWVHDWYDPFYYGMSPPMDPQGPAMGTQRVRRGGHFANNASSITVYLRSSLEPETSIVTLGFRCAKNER